MKKRASKPSQIIGIIILIFVLSSQTLGNSKGTPFISTINYEVGYLNQVWDVEQNHNNAIIVASSSGLFEYDSEQWTAIDIPALVFSAHLSTNNNKMYLGGNGYIAELMNDSYGKLQVMAFELDSIPIHRYTDIIESPLHIYFYSEECIIELQKNTNTVTHFYKAPSGKKFIGMYTTDSDVYVNISELGIHTLKNFEFTLVPSLNHLINKEIILSLNLTEKTVLIGNNQSELFTVTGENLEPFTIEDQEFITSGILLNACNVGESIYFGTQNFGVIEVNMQNGETRKIINSDAGILSNQVQQVCIDNELGIWLAHTKGLSRIETKLPIANYTSFTGLDAHVNTISIWNNKLYIAASNGVYALDTIKKFTTKSAHQKVAIPVAPQAVTVAQPTTITSLSQTDKETTTPAKEQKKKKFLGKLFRKKDDVAVENPEPTPVLKETLQAPTTAPKKKIEYHYVKFDKAILKSKHFGFLKLDIIDNPCHKFHHYNNELIAVTDNAVYAISKENEVLDIFKSNRILNTHLSNNNLLYIVSELGLYAGEKQGKKWQFKQLAVSSYDSEIRDIIEVDYSSGLILSISNKLFYYNQNSQTEFEININNPFDDKIELKATPSQINAIIGHHIYALIPAGDSVTVKKFKQFRVSTLLSTQDNNLWLRNNEGDVLNLEDSLYSEKIISFLNLFNDVSDIYIENKENLWVVDNKEDIYHLDLKSFQNYKISNSIRIKQLASNNEILSGNSIKLKPSQNQLDITLISPNFLKQNSSQYQYRLRGVVNSWSDWSSENIISLPYLPPGKVTIQIRSKNVFGMVSSPVEVHYRLSPPFHKTVLFYFLCSLLIAAGIYIWLQMRVRRLRKEKVVLYNTVKKRTFELAQKNKSIIDSINYAGKIQRAIIPPENKIEEFFEDSFVLFKPKDIVSGDFFWIGNKEDKVIIAAVDCTGHGVPGAFLSMLGSAFLKEIVHNSDDNLTAAHILNTLRQRIIELFAQYNKYRKDGMDMTIVLIDRKQKTLQFSGAHNSLFYVTPLLEKRNEKNDQYPKLTQDAYQLIQVKGDRFPVGSSNKNHIPFTNHEFDYHRGDSFYLYSDGYPDQFGGPEERKFMFGPFKRLILDLQGKSMAEQKEIFNDTIVSWQGKNDQTDDILLIGGIL